MAPFYPLSPALALRQHFVGKKLSELPTPSLVLDRSLVARNCAAMLQVCGKLGVGFRAHVKSHKTGEVARMMVGEGLEVGGGRDLGAGFVVSTLVEAEELVEYVREVQGEGREGSVSPVLFFIYSLLRLGCGCV